MSFSGHQNNSPRHAAGFFCDRRSRRWRKRVCTRTERSSTRSLDDPRRFWDARFADATLVYGEEPRKERNAVHLARLGHGVIAQDISTIGLAKARRLAKRHGVSIATVCSDLAEFNPEPNSVDLVVAIWMHRPPALGAEGHAKAVAALRSELAGLQLLAMEERQWAIAEGSYHRGMGAVAQVHGRKPGEPASPQSERVRLRK